MRARALLATLAVAALAAGAHAALPTPDAAAAEAFPGAVVERRTWALDEGEMSRVESLSGTRPASRLVAGFVATRDRERAGLALLDAHVVRSKQQTLLVSVGADLAIRRIDVLAFTEPREYLPPERWLRQFDGRQLCDDLELQRGLRAITGASLTSRAATDAARRCAAIATVLAERSRP